MKALKDLFGNKITKKTISSFLNRLDLNDMIVIKGGEDGDYWPPAGPTGNEN